MTQDLSTWLAGFSELFFPQVCITCRRKLFSSEKYICLFCIQELPRTLFHLDEENKVARLFWGRVEILYATSWLFFRKGSPYQQLIHYLKYKGLKELGQELGYLFGNDLRESPFSGCELVIPVPLHPAKEKKRGYNQSEWIARGIAGALALPLPRAALVRAADTQTQTRKSRFERWQNVEGIFEVPDPELILGRHILLIDDVVTTGSTLEAAAQALLCSGAAGVSLATLAIADF
ncbi:MAG: ComF family protein [Bacteroidota bacterium]